MLKVQAVLAAHLSGSRCWSYAARVPRCQRAIARGYVTAHSAPDRKFVETTKQAAPLVKQMVVAKELHMAFDDDLKKQHHFLRRAAIVVAPLLSTEEQILLDGRQKRADKTKHWHQVSSSKLQAVVGEEKWLSSEKDFAP